MSRPQQKHPCLQLDSVVAALRPKSLVGISQIGLVLIAAYDGLHLAFHLCQLLGIPEDDLQELLLQPREVILLQNDTMMISHAKQLQVPSSQAAVVNAIQRCTASVIKAHKATRHCTSTGIKEHINVQMCHGQLPDQVIKAAT